jgi:hypothetical protein
MKWYLTCNRPLRAVSGLDDSSQMRALEQLRVPLPKLPFFSRPISCPEGTCADIVFCTYWT